VADVVPKEGTPELKPKLLSSTPLTTAAPDCGLMAADVLVEAIGAGESDPLLLPPQATSKALPLKTRQARENLLKFIKNP
jgi:hypothetical protein